MEDDHQKKLKNSTDSKSEYKSSIGSKGSRGSSENDYPKIAGNLKETTSTSSAETMIIQKKQAPAFLKCKSKAMLNKKFSDSRLDRENFKIIKKLGQGKFGRVLMVL